MHVIAFCEGLPISLLRQFEAPVHEMTRNKVNACIPTELSFFLDTLRRQTPSTWQASTYYSPVSKVRNRLLALPQLYQATISCSRHMKSTPSRMNH